MSMILMLRFYGTKHLSLAIVGTNYRIEMSFILNENPYDCLIC